MNDTIVAVATPIGKAALAIIRMSGEESISIGNKIFKGSNLKNTMSHTIHYGKIIDGDEPIDEVMIAIFLAPKTFTTENVVEIYCHGGVFITNQIVELCIRNGARLALPGEFTRRAFLNGRIDLTQAESIMDMIDAKTKSMLKIANQGLRGDVKDGIIQFRDALLSAIAKIEVNIDYPEYEDEVIITNEILLPMIDEFLYKIEAVIQRSEQTLLIKEGINTAIIGRPNVGKSSLLNALLREDKAIVTEIAGTTRDVVEGQMTVGGVLLNLLDTAGIRYTSDVVEKIGVMKTKKILDQAVLLLLVFDYSEELTQTDFELLEMTKNKKRIIVVNKVDLEKQIDLTAFDEYLLLSSFEKSDILQLESKIVEKMKLDVEFQNEGQYVSSARAMAKLKIVHQHVLEAKQSLINNLPIDIANIDLTSAWKALGEIIGETSTDDLIQEMFSRFCLGK